MEEGVTKRRCFWCDILIIKITPWGDANECWRLFGQKVVHLMGSNYDPNVTPTTVDRSIKEEERKGLNSMEWQMILNLWSEGCKWQDRRIGVTICKRLGSISFSHQHADFRVSRLNCCREREINWLLRWFLLIFYEICFPWSAICCSLAPRLRWTVPGIIFYRHKHANTHSFLLFQSSSGSHFSRGQIGN